MKNLANLSEKEKRVLAGLYKVGRTTVSKLSKETLINRTTLYPILEKLLKKGLISKLFIGDSTIYQPISLDEFKEWAKRKEQEVIKDTRSLLVWAKAQEGVEKNTLLSEIRYFEGFEGIKNLYSDTWRNNKDKMIYGITDYKAAYETMGDDFFRKDYFKTRVNHGVRVKNLLPKSEAGERDLKEAKELLREMKFIKLFKNLGIDINIYDNRLAIMAFDKEKPSGVLIKNDIIAKAFKNIFEYLWKSVK
ncbi:hypothetical protein HQ544_01420 [Candidatus Falkowbacteria bacterium]|nr:hypothetical protein [Candidatus Falkowbacteria bacterium]